MPVNHYLSSGLWHDDALDGLAFEGVGFFAYLFSNDRTRPSGVYRVSDEQLAVDTTLPVARVRAYLGELVTRRRIVRDGAWIFVRGVFKRLPKSARLLVGAQRDIDDCSSEAILSAWAKQYPAYSRWSADRHETISRWSTEGHETIKRPSGDGVTPARGEREGEGELATEATTTPEGHETISRWSTEGHETIKRPSATPAAVAASVILWLNQKASRTFEPRGVNLDLVVARLKEGADPYRLKAMISAKVREWAEDPKMRRYLRPATLFNREKCAQYLGELPPPPTAEPEEGPDAPAW